MTFSRYMPAGCSQQCKVKSATRTVRAPQLQCLIMTSYTEPPSGIVKRPPAQRAARPRLRPRPHHARRPLPRRGLLARAAHAHERPVALRLRREEDRPAGQRRVDLAEPRLHPLPQRLCLRAVCIAEPSITTDTQSPSMVYSSSSAAIASLAV